MSVFPYQHRKAYEWHYNRNNDGWLISDDKDGDYNLNTALIAGESWSVYCVVTDRTSGISATTNTCVFTVAAAGSFSANLPGTVTAVQGVHMQGQIVPIINNGSGNYAYEWHYKVNDGRWNVSGDRDNDYNLSIALKAGDTWSVYCVVTDRTAGISSTTNTCTFVVGS